ACGPRALAGGHGPRARDRPRARRGTRRPDLGREPRGGRRPDLVHVAGRADRLSSSAPGRCTFRPMKHALAGVALALALVVSATAAAGGKTVQSTLTGKCSAANKLEHNGALLSTTVVCNATASCKCAG